MLQFYNHKNSPVWSKKNESLNNSANGARSYSEAITKYYFPVFEEVFKDDPVPTCVITVTTENAPIQFSGFKRIFLFLHECRHLQQPTIARAKKFAELNRQAKVYFIVWEEGTAQAMKEHGLNSIFLPMAIDVAEVRSHLLPRTSKAKNKIIWFGNVRAAKAPFYKYFISEARKLGWVVDTISGNYFNHDKTQKLSRDEILQVLQYYDYGVGVGICAHEMSALGLKVFIYSYNYKCNCAYSKQEGQYWVHRNLCSPEQTSVLVSDAIKNRDRMVVIDPVDIHENVKLLRKSLRNISEFNHEA